MRRGAGLKRIGRRKTYRILFEISTGACHPCAQGPVRKRIGAGKSVKLFFEFSMRACHSCTAEVKAPPRKKNEKKSWKKFVTLLDLCVSSLRRGYANLLCIVPILTDDLRRGSKREDRKGCTLRCMRISRRALRASKWGGPRTWRGSR